MNREAERAMNKLALCIRGARECSRNSWQEPRKDRKTYLTIKREAMQDARYWINKLKECAA